MTVVHNNKQLREWLMDSGHIKLSLMPSFTFNTVSFSIAKAEVVRQHPEEKDPDARAAYRLLSTPKPQPKLKPSIAVIPVPGIPRWLKVSFGGGGSAAWEALINTANTPTTFTGDNIAELLTFNATANYSTENFFRISQNTGNPTGLGSILLVDAADVDVTTLLRIDHTGDADSMVTIDSGSTTGQVSALVLEDQGVEKWRINKLSSNNFNIFDSVAGVFRIQADVSSNNRYKLGNLTGAHIFSDSAATRRFAILGNSDAVNFGASGDVTLTRTAVGVLDLVSILDVNTGFRINGLAATDDCLLGNATNFVASSTCALSTDNLSFFTSTTSAQFLGVISDETGTTGLVVASINPTLTDVVVDDVIEFTESIGDATCVAGNYNIKGNSSTGALRGCENGTLFNLNTAGGSAHDLLSATHSDTLAAAVSRGSIILGNVTPAWSELVIGAANTFLGSDATDATWTGLTLASAQFANQGTTTTVLHGNAAGNPSFAAVTSADTTGTFPPDAEALALADLTDVASTSGTGTVALLNSTPTIITPSFTTGFTIGGVATAGRYPRGNGTNFVQSAGSASGVGTCTNQFAQVLNDDAAPTCDSVVLTTDVSGILPNANGGTGISTAASTGVPRVDSGTWTVSELSGDVTTSGSNATSIAAGVVASAELATANKTFDKSIVLIDPTTAEDDLIQWMHGKAVTYTNVDCSTDVGTVTIDMDHRVITTPNTVGTDILTGTIVCDTNNQADGGFADATIPANVPVNLSITAVATSPGTVRIHIRGTVD